jgi:hypothetical protein
VFLALRSLDGSGHEILIGRQAKPGIDEFVAIYLINAGDIKFDVGLFTFQGIGDPLGKDLLMDAAEGAAGIEGPGDAPSSAEVLISASIGITETSKVDKATVSGINLRKVAMTHFSDLVLSVWRFSD